MRAIGYERVSTREQGDSGAGLDAQRRLITSEISRRDWELVGFKRDVSSGASMKKRDQLTSALRDLDAGHAEVLVVAKLDRLSRSLLDFAQLMVRAKENGWSLVALDLGVDTSTPNGKLLANIVAAMAEWERELISQRTKAGLESVTARGTQLGRRRNVPDDVVATIRLQREQGVGWSSIARRLNEDGVPTAQGGAQWYPATVRRVHALYAPVSGN